LVPYAARRPINNFGDLLGPLIVRAVLRTLGRRKRRVVTDARLLTVGSILHFARDGDVIWGSGINGKISADAHAYSTLDVRAVRGPLTRDFLVERGIPVPEVYGDPALLLPHVMPWLRRECSSKQYGLTVVPNLNDIANYPVDSRLLQPTKPLNEILTRIARSEFVVGSSLHAIIIADALGIPARFVVSGSEAPHKYTDYFLGTARAVPDFAETVADATAMGGHEPLVFAPERLLAAFPADLWRDPPIRGHITGVRGRRAR
jgi:pyruvyltransferase